jgi:hypothetical protein
MALQWAAGVSIRSAVNSSAILARGLPSITPWNSQFLIAYARYTVSNAWELTEYAWKREKKGLLHVENLAQRANFSLHFASDTVDPKL